MRIIVLEGDSMGPDISWEAFRRFGDVTFYHASTDRELPEKLKDADIAIANKVHFNEETIGGLTKLKLVVLTATGMDNLDRPYLESRGIAYRNAAGYSTHAVAPLHSFFI